MNRREFVLSSMAALGVSACGRFATGASAEAAPHPIGLQLYTLRTIAEKDLDNVLAAVRKIGIEELELYPGVYNHGAKALSAMLKKHGLRSPSGHFDYNGFDTHLQFAQELGMKYVVCPMLPRDMWNSIEGFQRAADQFNKWGEKAKSAGMRFAFHNHNYEFRRFGDTTGYDALVSRTDPSLVLLEADCYWLTQAGNDPVAVLRKLGSRVRMLHIKDRKPGFDPSTELGRSAEHFTEVGTGTIDYKAILAVARENGVEHYFLEQDSMERPPLESVATSYNNFRKLLA